MIETPNTESRVGEHILTAIADAEQEKSSTKQFLISHNSTNRIIFETNNGFSNGYRKILEKWVSDPQNVEGGNVGYPLEVFYKDLLKNLFPNTAVYLSPSSLDNKLFRDTAPADLIVGEEMDDCYTIPILLISSKLSKNQKAVINPLLNSPEINLNAERIFGKKKYIFNLLYEYITTDNLDGFFLKVLKDNGEYIINDMLQNLNLIDKRNCIVSTTEEGVKKKRILNSIVNWKIRYITEILNKEIEKYKKDDKKKKGRDTVQ